MPGIGLLNEKSLHASLKQWYARPGDRFEVAVGRFVIDIVRDDLLIEIQTGNFASIKAKLTKLLDSHAVRLIYPIVQERWIVRSAAEHQGRIIRRKSPKRGRWEDLFREMVSIPQLLTNRNFSLEVLMIKEEQARRYEGKRQWRRGGWGIEARRLLEVLDRRLFQRPADWHACIPAGLESFTARDLATATNTRGELAQKIAYCLRLGSVIELVGRRGRANLYRVPIMTSTWTCPKCKRQFTRTNQRHACGTGDRADVLRNRPPEVVKLYAALEAFAKSLGPVEFVTRDRYVLLRSRRIFADAVVMSDALRLAIHLPRTAAHELFIKVASDRRHVTHVAKLRAIGDLESMKPFLREAYEHSIS